MAAPVSIRRATVSDAAAVHRIYAPVVRETAISFEYEVPDEVELARRIAETLDRWEWLVAEHEDGVAGYAYGGSFRGRAAYRYATETSVFVDPDHQGRGVGRSLMTALLDELAGRDFTIAYAGIALPNPGSVRLHEALGFAPVGVFERAGYKFDRWHDVGFWQLDLRHRLSS